MTINILTVIILTMQDEWLASQVCTALMRIGTRMATVFDQQFAPLGLTQAQFRLLLAVREEGGAEGIASSVLAERLLLERATVSVLTTRLVERGLLRRTDGENRRTFLLRLTDESRALLEQVVPHAVALADHTLADFSLEEMRRTLALLDTLESHLRGGDRPASPPTPDRA